MNNITPLPYKFDSRIRNGALIESYVQRALSYCGFTVVMKPHRIRKEWEKPNIFNDQVDLDVYVDETFITKLEVKSKPNTYFETVKDFPFPDVTLCKLEENEEITKLPFTFVSGLTGAILATLPSSNRFIGEQEDKERKIRYKVSKAPKSDLVNFETLLRWLGVEYKRIKDFEKM